MGLFKSFREMVEEAKQRRESSLDVNDISSITESDMQATDEPVENSSEEPEVEEENTMETPADVESTILTAEIIYPAAFMSSPSPQAEEQEVVDQEDEVDDVVPGFTEEEVQEHLSNLEGLVNESDLALIGNHLRNDRWMSSIRSRPQLVPVGPKRLRSLGLDRD